MSPTVDFGKLLSVQVDSVERPPLFPAGHYRTLVQSYELDESSRKKTPYCRFNCKLLAPGEDVDMDLFEDAGGIAKLNERKTLRYDFYLTPDAYYRLREFLEEGLALNCAGRAFDQVIPDAVNMEFMAEVTHAAGQKPNEFYMEITDHAPAE